MFKPLLAVKHNPSKLVFPYLISPKLDGIRGILSDRVLTRTLKLVPSKQIRDYYTEVGQKYKLDGEFILGSPTAKDVFRDTHSAVMTIESQDLPDFYVFDWVGDPSIPFVERYARTAEMVKELNAEGYDKIKLVQQCVVSTIEEMEEYEIKFLDLGYEGAMLRSLEGRYKYGRSTVNENILLKVKRFEDSEAKIIRVNELMSNQNTATKDELGGTKRSTHKENLVPSGVMGSITVKDFYEGYEFEIGTGFTAKERAYFWDNREDVVGRLVKYQYFVGGMKDLPRFPSYKGFRDVLDVLSTKDKQEV